MRMVVRWGARLAPCRSTWTRRPPPWRKKVLLGWSHTRTTSLLETIAKVDMIDKRGNVLTDPNAMTGPGHTNTIRLHIDFQAQRRIQNVVQETTPKVGSSAFCMRLYKRADGTIVTACLKRETNPDAPDVVLPGRGPVIEARAELFEQQGHAVPTFIKDAVNRWRYVGMYRVNRRSLDPREIAVHAARAGRSGQVSQLLFLECVR